MSRPLHHPLLLFDGECGLCHALVRLLLRWDRDGGLRFAPLQGSTGQSYLRTFGLNTADFDSLVFVRDRNNPARGYALRTDGALEVIAELGGAWRAVALLRIIPAAWRDVGYRLIARFRYRLFGEYRPRPLPNPQWTERILR